MKIILGLGNPGPEYAVTRHNVAWMFLDWLAAQEGGFSDFFPTKFAALAASGEVAGEKVLLVKPLSYMNLSGEPARKLLDFYKVAVPDLLVVSDDVDMEFGKTRYRAQGSAGGHNGLKSLIQHLGTDAFHRVKIGVGRDARRDTADWVLSKFRPEEVAALEDDVFPRAMDALAGVPGWWGG